MQKILSVLLLIMIFACSSSVPASAESKLDHHEKKIQDLVGQIDRQALLEMPYLTWYEKNYSSYTPDESIIENLKNSINGVQIKAFMGTWCHDSQRETPRLYKILDNAEFDLKNLSLIALSHSKTTPEQFEKDQNLQRTPTFIFYKDDVEIGRIVETPRESLEKDILKIVTGQEYKHSYQDL